MCATWQVSAGAQRLNVRTAMARRVAMNAALASSTSSRIAAGPPSDARDRLLDVREADDRHRVRTRRDAEPRRADGEGTRHRVASAGGSGPGLVSSSVSSISIHQRGL